MILQLDKKSLPLVFTACLFLQLFAPAISPNLGITYFAPFLVIGIYQRSLPGALILGCVSGITLDLLSTLPHFGIYTLDCCLAVFLLYPQKGNFFADNISTLPIMTFFFGVLSSSILAALLYIIEMQNILSGTWIITDLILMSGLDALYALVVFTIPSLIFGKRLRRGKDYFT